MDHDTPDEQERLRQLQALLAGDVLHVFGLAPDSSGLPQRIGEIGIRDGVPVLDAMAALELIDPAEAALAIEAVGRVMEHGFAVDELHMADGSWSTSHVFDLRETYGMIAGVVVPSSRLDRVMASARPTVAPRVGHVHMDAQGRIIWMSDSFRRILGYEELAGDDSVLAYVDPQDSQKHFGVWAAMLATPGEPHRLRYRRRHGDGHWLWCETTIVNRLDDPENPRVDAEVLDISGEMAAHEEVRARERLLQRLAEGLPDGVLQLDARRQVVYANGRALRLLGAEPSPAALVARTVETDRPALSSALEAALGAGEDQVVEVRVRPPATDGPSSPEAARELAVYEVTLRSVVEDDAHPDDEPTITGAIVSIADVTEQANRRSELEARATFDDLTGSYNRASTVAALTTALADVQSGNGVAVVFVDLDKFKQVNDVHGHAVGDRLLRTVAGRLRHAVRTVDIVGRLGGDEFLVVCPGLVSPATAADVVDRIDRSLSEPATLGRDLTLVPRASLGVAWTFDTTTAADALIHEADASMYDAKRARAVSEG